MFHHLLYVSPVSCTFSILRQYVNFYINKFCYIIVHSFFFFLFISLDQLWWFGSLKYLWKIIQMPDRADRNWSGLLINKS